jgi:tryptophan-rich sensory protein
MIGDPMKRDAKSITSLVLFLALVMGGGLIIGFVTAPGEWYATLRKPPFSPPN